MAKITAKVPALTFRKQAVETPPNKAQIVKRALSAQQDRLAGRLTRKAAQPDQIVATSTWASRFPGMARLSRQNPEAARQLDRAAAASSARSSRSRYVLPGLLGLIGAAAGVAASRRTTRDSRTELAQQTGRYALIVVRQTAVSGRSLGGQAMRGASGARARLARRRGEIVDPETVADRVRTELGEDQALRHLPRINVNTEPDGIVYLRGMVPGEGERELAEQIARRQRGVLQVVNELQVQAVSEHDGLAEPATEHS